MQREHSSHTPPNAFHSSVLFRGIAAAICISLPCVVCWGCLDFLGRHMQPPTGSVSTPNPAKAPTTEAMMSWMVSKNPVMAKRLESWKPRVLVVFVLWSLITPWKLTQRPASLTVLIIFSIMIGLSLAFPWMLFLIVP